MEAVSEGRQLLVQACLLVGDVLERGPKGGRCTYVSDRKQHSMALDRVWRHQRRVHRRNR